MTDLEVTYFPSASDTASGTLTLYLNSTSDGICSSIYDSLVVTFIPQPYLVSSKGVLCTLNNGVDVGMLMNNGNPGTWSTSGTGVFSPSIAEYNAKYYPSQDDFDNGNMNND